MVITSLRLRLLTAASVIIALALLLTAFILIQLFETQVSNQVKTSLRQDLLQIAGGINLGADGRLVLAPPLTDARYNMPFGVDATEHRYWQVDLLPAPGGSRPGQSLRSVSLWDESLDQQHQIGPRGEDLITVKDDVKLNLNGRPATVSVVVAADAAEIIRPLNEVRRKVVVAFAIVGTLLIIGTWLQVTVGLSPMRRLQTQLAAIRRGAARRLWGAFPDEVAPLVREFNDVLDMRDDSLERARRRAGDLAHGLKTPLTVLSTISRQLRKEGLDRVAADIDEQCDAMVRHVERTLVRARLASGKGHAASELLGTVQRVAGAVERLPGADALRFDLLVPPEARVPIEQRDLTELLGNLMDNARKWATSTVRVRYANPYLTIEDDGPGVPDDALAHLGERGRRLDESIQGSGLGLSIVEDIADIYGLAVSYGQSELGGLRVDVRV